MKVRARPKVVKLIADTLLINVIYLLDNDLTYDYVRSHFLLLRRPDTLMNDPQMEAQASFAKKKFMTRQLHFSVTETDYEFISSIAADNEETIATTLRNMVRAARKAYLEKHRNRGTNVVPIS